MHIVTTKDWIWPLTWNIALMKPITAPVRMPPMMASTRLYCERKQTTAHETPSMEPCEKSRQPIAMIIHTPHAAIMSM